MTNSCPAGGSRFLTPGEIALTQSIFGDAIDCASVTIRRRKWFPFQPSKVVMAPRGHLHFHPKATSYCDDFSLQSLSLQGFFLHEMTHIWQHQRGIFLPLRRLPWARYDYSLKPGWPLERYGLEQQAEIVRHAFLLRNGVQLHGVADEGTYETLVSFADKRS